MNMPQAPTIEAYLRNKRKPFSTEELDSILSMVRAGVRLDLEDPKGGGLLKQYNYWFPFNTIQEVVLRLFNFSHTFGPDIVHTLGEAMKGDHRLNGSGAGWVVWAQVCSGATLQKVVNHSSSFRMSLDEKKIFQTFDAEHQLIGSLAFIQIREPEMRKDVLHMNLEKYAPNLSLPHHDVLWDLFVLEEHYQRTDAEDGDYQYSGEVMPDWPQGLNVKNLAALIQHYPTFHPMLSNTVLHHWNWLEEKPRLFCEGTAQEMAVFLNGFYHEEQLNAVLKGASPEEMMAVRAGLNQAEPRVRELAFECSLSTLNTRNANEVLDFLKGMYRGHLSPENIQAKIKDAYLQRQKKDNKKDNPELLHLLELEQSIQPAVAPSLSPSLHVRF